MLIRGICNDWRLAHKCGRIAHVRGESRAKRKPSLRDGISIRGISALTGYTFTQRRFLLMETKRCSKCGEWKNHSEFCKDARLKDGIKGICKTCFSVRRKEIRSLDIDAVRAAARHYAHTHKDKIKQYSESYHRTHADEIRQRRHEYYIKNKNALAPARKRYADEHREIQRKRNAEYYKSHEVELRKYQHLYRKTQRGREVARLAKRIRRARRLNLPATLTSSEWKTILEAYDHRCAYCGTQFKLTSELHQEHVVPVNQGGGYTVDNIVPSCCKCNHKKGARTPEMAGMQKRVPKMKQLKLIRG